MNMALELAVVGAGWAGLAAAVRAMQAGHRVTLYEMAREAGGRARSVPREHLTFDNGQHILIGAYQRTLHLLRSLDLDPGALLLRLPLVLRFPDGRGLALRQGPPVLSLLGAIAGAKGFGWRDRAALLRVATRWARLGFTCDPGWTVARLCRDLPPVVRELLIDPLCVAALNTPADQASAAVFLRVLRDALLSGRGSSDLLLPCQPLSLLLPQPASHWLARRGATLRLGHRVQEVSAGAAGWTVDGRRFDAVILACPAGESARLVAAAWPAAAAWAAAAAAMPYEPIITVYVEAPTARLPLPLMALTESTDAPAQFVFDHGIVSGRQGLLACVISGARRWADAGLEATAVAALAQVRRDLAPWLGASPPRVLQTVAERRATFRCIPGLHRPGTLIAPGLLAAGDYVAGPYPATLEGAVRSAEAAVAALGRSPMPEWSDPA